ncbi:MULTISPECIES: thiol-disulfide oxidoreductase DCC family protein [Flavobacterium]|uniref:thiol-disulfide oxidoreductase DCC family protein n=1 Tax=Flavobacterium TaxID=237 RepID=UPI001FCC73CF|nr:MULTISPECIES: DCC1-like thiol-disulfide oxidoreductase family protein [Flavobacterium]UOK41676.1 DCC1-like thiol-disulfide oxidoreductase family protein [Flavobacterium enshiense]
MELPTNKKIILFDGVCNLCDATVQKVIKHDKNDTFRFVSLQSDLGKEIVRYIGIDITKTDSIILYEPGHAYHIKAEAAFEIAKSIGGIYSLLGLFAIFPNWLTNIGYDFVARNRYKWFGKKESCMIPTPEIKSKFLE